MPFIETTGDGPNYERAFSLRPAVYQAWNALNAAIKETADLRRHELATVAAARRLRSSYCALAHGRILAEQFVGAEAVQALMTEPRSASLEEVDVAVAELAEKIVADATSVTQGDIDRLHGLGLTDAEILDVVLAAAARCFFSKVLDAVGAEADPHFRDLEPGLRDALTVGRPIAPA